MTKPTQSEIADDIKDIILNYTHLENLTLYANFTSDLGLDSLDQVEIIMEVEDYFNIQIADEDTNINSLAEAVTAVTKYLK